MITAIYARKSTEQTGIADEQKSVARQVDHARAYAARKGWTVADEHVYVDNGISGAETKRLRERARMIEAASNHRFDAVIMQAQDRFSRGEDGHHELKQLSRHVAVWFYVDDQCFKSGSFESNTLGFLTAEFAAEYRRAIAAKTSEAMQRKARAGHVCGGRVFGYDNVDVAGPSGKRSHVVLQTNTGEATVVRQIFDLFIQGEGLRGIAKRLNAEGATSPRAQQGRPRGWAPSSVREVLHRELYRGQRVWNKSKKRNASGEKQPHDRPASEWLTVDAEDLRIIPQATWRAAHDKIDARTVAYQRWRAGQPGGAPDGRGVRTRYFLTGFSRCQRCGGSMQAVSRKSTRGRIFQYVCGTYWNRGSSVCRNGRLAGMRDADDAVHQLLAEEVLRPTRIERAIERAIELLAGETTVTDQRSSIERRLAALDSELANLAETAARGGAVPAVLELLARRDEERRRLQRQLTACDVVTPRIEGKVLRTRLRGFIDDWSGLLTENVAEARPLLELVLADRIAFTPSSSGGWELTVPIAFDRVMTAAIPEWRGLQDRMASPPGPNHILRHDYVLEIGAA